MTAEYQTMEKALAYLATADQISERVHGERMLLRLLPSHLNTVLDLGCGDGRLLALVKAVHPTVRAVAADFSLTMLERANERFGCDETVQVEYVDFASDIRHLGKFDAIVSSFAIHHVEDERKWALYAEIYSMLNPGGVFANLEHVLSPTENLHAAFLADIGQTRETEDQSNRCAAVEPQLSCLRSIGFEDVDCFWKWRELALLAGTKPLR